MILRCIRCRHQLFAPEPWLLWCRLCRMLFVGEPPADPGPFRARVAARPGGAAEGAGLLRDLALAGVAIWREGEDAVGLLAEEEPPAELLARAPGAAAALEALGLRPAVPAWARNEAALEAWAAAWARDAEPRGEEGLRGAEEEEA